MKSGIRFMGHAVHPMLIVFPLGLFVTSLVFDILYAITDNPTLAVVSYYMISAGILGGLLAAVFGVIDWSAIPAGTRAKAVGLWHGVVNVVVVTLFAASWLMRRDIPEQPETLAIMLSALGIVLGGVSGWLGGELVERLGVGVHRGAHLNSPSSLSGHSAEESVSGVPRRPGMTSGPDSGTMVGGASR